MFAVAHHIGGTSGCGGGGSIGVEEMNPLARYPKIVEWSDEDQCFVRRCPNLFYGGCHGDDERAVFAELCELVDETIERFQREGRPLPPVRVTYVPAEELATST